MHNPRHAPRLGLRAASLASTGIIGVLVIGVLTALLASSRTMWRSDRAAERDIHAVDTTTDIERALREYQRLSNAWLVTRAPEVAEARRAAKAELDASLEDLHAHGSDAEERRRAAAVADAVAQHLEIRAGLEARSPALDDYVTAARPSLERALAATDALREKNERDRAESSARADRQLRLQTGVTIVAVSTLALALAGIAVGFHWLVVRPVLDLKTAVRSFRVGEPTPKAPEARMRETAELAAGFNELTQTIHRQRLQQLTFLAGVAHDLRSPLSALKLTVQVMAHDFPAALERSRQLDRQLDRLARMVGDLLDATRVEAGELELRVEQVDLTEVARSVVELYSPTTTSHTLTLAAPSAPVLVRADSHRIQQVLGNLVSNAIKYSPDGGPVAVEVSREGDEAIVSVTDHGVGIPEHDIPGIFLPFARRLDTAGIAPGTGLGLSVSRRIVLAHRGRIDVASTPGVGSTFRVHLPAPQQTEAAGFESR